MWGETPSVLAEACDPDSLLSWCEVRFQQTCFFGLWNMQAKGKDNLYTQDPIVIAIVSDAHVYGMLVTYYAF